MSCCPDLERTSVCFGRQSCVPHRLTVWLPVVWKTGHVSIALSLHQMCGQTPCRFCRKDRGCINPLPYPGGLIQLLSRAPFTWIRRTCALLVVKNSVQIPLINKVLCLPQFYIVLCVMPLLPPPLPAHMEQPWKEYYESTSSSTLRTDSNYCNLTEKLVPFHST